MSDHELLDLLLGDMGMALSFLYRNPDDKSNAEIATTYMEQWSSAIREQLCENHKEDTQKCTS